MFIGICVLHEVQDRVVVVEAVKGSRCHSRLSLLCPIGRGGEQ